VDLAIAPRNQQAVHAVPRLGEQQRGETTGDVVEHEPSRVRAKALCQLLGGIESRAEAAAMAADARRDDAKRMTKDKITGKHHSSCEDRGTFDARHAGGGATDGSDPHHCTRFDHRERKRKQYTHDDGNKPPGRTLREHEYRQRTRADFGVVVHRKRLEQHGDECVDSDQDRKGNGERHQVGPVAYADGEKKQQDEKDQQRDVDAAEYRVVRQAGRVSDLQQPARLQVPRRPERSRGESDAVLQQRDRRGGLLRDHDRFEAV
jgi:hypothetical protein